MTRVTVDLVFTTPSVLTRTTGTLVDVCGDAKLAQFHLKASKMFLYCLHGWMTGRADEVGGGLSACLFACLIGGIID